MKRTSRPLVPGLILGTQESSSRLITVVDHLFDSTSTDFRLRIALLVAIACPCILIGAALHKLVSGNSWQRSCYLVYGLLFRVPGLGTVHPDSPPSLAFVLNAVFLFGTFIFAILLSVFVNEIKARFKAARERERERPLQLSGHVLLLNWNGTAAAILQQVAAAQQQPSSLFHKRTIVVMSDVPHGELHAAVQRTLRDYHGVALHVRSGHSYKAADMRRVCALSASSIMVLLPPATTPDAAIALQVRCLVCMAAMEEHHSGQHSRSRSSSGSRQHVVVQAHSTRPRYASSPVRAMAQHLDARGSQLQVVELADVGALDHLIARTALQPYVASVLGQLISHRQPDVRFQWLNFSDELANLVSTRSSKPMSAWRGLPHLALFGTLSRRFSRSPSGQPSAASPGAASAFSPDRTTGVTSSRTGRSHSVLCELPSVDRRRSDADKSRSRRRLSANMTQPLGAAQSPAALSVPPSPRYPHDDTGASYKSVRRLWDHALVIGVLAAGDDKLLLNPPEDLPVYVGDSLLLIVPQGPVSPSTSASFGFHLAAERAAFRLQQGKRVSDHSGQALHTPVSECPAASRGRLPETHVQSDGFCTPAAAGAAAAAAAAAAADVCDSAQRPSLAFTPIGDLLATGCPAQHHLNGDSTLDLLRGKTVKVFGHSHDLESGLNSLAPAHSVISFPTCSEAGRSGQLSPWDAVLAMDPAELRATDAVVLLRSASTLPQEGDAMVMTTLLQLHSHLTSAVCADGGSLAEVARSSCAPHVVCTLHNPEARDGARRLLRALTHPVSSRFSSLTSPFAPSLAFTCEMLIPEEYTSAIMALVAQDTRFIHLVHALVTSSVAGTEIQVAPIAKLLDISPGEHMMYAELQELARSQHGWTVLGMIPHAGFRAAGDGRVVLAPPMQQQVQLCDKDLVVLLRGAAT